MWGRRGICAIAGLILGAGVMAGPAFAAEPAAQPSSCGVLMANQDGTFSPMLCPNGRPNAKAWPKIRMSAPHLAALADSASLGGKPTWAQIKKATCQDVPDASFPIVSDAYQWLNARYGWTKAGLPSATAFNEKLVNGLCG